CEILAGGDDDDFDIFHETLISAPDRPGHFDPFANRPQQGGEFVGNFLCLTQVHATLASVASTSSAFSSGRYTHQRPYPRAPVLCVSPRTYTASHDPPSQRRRAVQYFKLRSRAAWASVIAGRPLMMRIWPSSDICSSRSNCFT